MIGLRFVELHIEGILMAGSFPSLIGGNGSQINIDSLDIVDLVVQSANLSNLPLLFSYWNGFASSIKVNGFSMINNYNTSEINTPFYIFGGVSPSSAGGLGDDTAVFVIESGYLREAATSNNQTFANYLGLDGHMPVGTFVGPQKFARYEFGAAASKVTGAVIVLTANNTHYGQHENATLIVPASITSFTITLANTMSATGNQPVRTGNTVHIRRQSGTASGTLTITPQGGSSTTNTTAATDYWFQFSGTAWASLTPVT